MNYIAIAIATVVTMVIGSLWYSPLMFAKIWAAHIKFKDDPKMTHWHLIQATGVALAMTVGLAYIFNALNITEPLTALKTAAFLWLIFIATSHFNAVIWAKKSIVVYLIDVAYFLVTISAASAVLAYWR